MMEPFLAARLKIERANHHISELHAEIERYLKSDCYTMRMYRDPNTGERVLHIKQERNIPYAISLVLGDAAHNLRTALDLAACDIVRMSGHDPGRFTKFPFGETRQELVSAINGGKLKAAGTDIISLIVDTIKPHKGGDDALLGLHDLDVADKHHLVIPVASFARVTHLGLSRQTMALRIVGTDAPEAISSWPKLPVENYGKVSIDIFFAENQPFEGRPVMPTLAHLSQLVARTVDALAKEALA